MRKGNKVGRCFGFKERVERGDKRSSTWPRGRGLGRNGKTGWEEGSPTNKSRQWSLVLADSSERIKAQPRNPEGPTLSFTASESIGTAKGKT